MCILVYSFMVFRVFKIIAVLGFVLIDMGLDAQCCLIDILSFLDCVIFHIIQVIYLVSFGYDSANISYVGKI